MDPNLSDRLARGRDQYFILLSRARHHGQGIQHGLLGIPAELTRRVIAPISSGSRIQQDIDQQADAVVPHDSHG